jgi:serine-type D-Ala-D-Ala carboxypeptidase/endopeptidase (penicillin-binding protein 4)
MRRILGGLVAVVVLAAPQPATALDAQQVRTRVLSAFAGAGPASGAYAVHLGSGRPIVAVREQTPRIPASVEKLFVTSTALLRWGPDHQLTTRVLTASTLDEEGTIDGDVWLVGGGDPTLTDGELRQLAGDVAATGVERIRGSVLADDTRFDRRRGTPRTGFAPDGDLGGRLGALLIGNGYQRDPALHATKLFAAALRARGVQVLGRTRRGSAPQDATAELAAMPSPTIGDLARFTNVPSDNFFAEMLLKALGADFGGGLGTTGSGAQIVRRTLAPAGVTPRVIDGSGLSRSNRTSPREVVRLFEHMESQPFAGVWRRSLAVAGRSGTLHDRMRGTPAAGRCRGKTGTIVGVSNLVGFCDTRGGRIAFAWLMNGVDPFGARRLQDRMTVAVARYDG